MTRVALALSPHLDDAVFSCGGTLAVLARQGWRVVVATLFTRSMPNPQGFALACQLDKGLGADVDYMALRRAEDTAAMNALGIEAPIHIALPEAPHRGYHSARQLFETPLAGDAIGPALTAEVADLIAQYQPDLVLAPQAIGGHVDHVQLVRAIPHVLPMLWWNDFPYLVRDASPLKPFHDRFNSMPEHLVTVDEEAQAAKVSACLAYRSQLGFQFGGPEGLRRKLAETGPREGFRGMIGESVAAALAG